MYAYSQYITNYPKLKLIFYELYRFKELYFLINLVPKTDILYPSYKNKTKDTK